MDIVVELERPSYREEPEHWAENWQRQHNQKPERSAGRRAVPAPCDADQRTNEHCGTDDARNNDHAFPGSRDDRIHALGSGQQLFFPQFPNMAATGLCGKAPPQLGRGLSAGGSP
jgi:hypothetical protein